jgi:prolyl-tRNA editing enzyme YbaK/EbsC (Cys-tRNA(Pro) deacylase)
MHTRAAEFRDRIRERYGIEIDVTEFPEGTETAAAAADAIGRTPAQIASSIVLALSGGGGSSDGATGEGDDGDDGDGGGEEDDGDDRLVVAITGGANRVDLDAAADWFGADAARMADADRVRETVGWSIGGVPPLCHDADLPTVIDPTLLEYDTVWAAAGTPATVFPIEPGRLRDLADATAVDLTESG